MTLSIGDAVSEGLSLAASRNGLTLMALFLVVETFALIVFLAAGTTYVPLDLGTGVATGSELPTGELPQAASAIAIVFAGVFNSLISVPISIIAIRTFVGGATDGIPDAYLFRRIGHATISGVLATFAQMALLFALSIGAGLLSVVLLLTIGGYAALIGILILVCVAIVGFALVWLHFLFLLHEIGVRDRGTVDAFRGSWATVRGHRLRVALLAVSLAVVRMTVSGIAAPGVDTTWTASRLALTAVTLVGSAVVGVAVVAILARAYRQLRPDVNGSDRSGHPTTEAADRGSSA